jgi:Protein of unknown function (DUF3592)
MKPMPIEFFAGSFRWANPGTWPWIVWACAAFAVMVLAKLAWICFVRLRTAFWPRAMARIESVSVQPAKSIFGGTSTSKGSHWWRAELVYSFSTDGHSYSGRYHKMLSGEIEGNEFVAGLEGRSASVAYHPGNPSHSLLPGSSLKSMRESLALEGAGKPAAVVLEAPGWLKPWLWPLVGLSAAGAALSLGAHVLVLTGRQPPSAVWFFILNVGMFAVWIPVIALVIKRGAQMGINTSWDQMLKGSPGWMFYMFYGFFAYAMINYGLMVLQAHSGHGTGDSWASDWRGFPGLWMLSYWAALVILYVAASSRKE